MDWRRHFSLGLVHYAAFPEVIQGKGPIVDTLRTVLCDNFFDAVELTWVHDEADKAAVAKLLPLSGCQTLFSGGPAFLIGGANLSALNQTERQAAVATACDLVDQALRFGAQSLMVISGPDPGPALRPAAKEALVLSLQTVAGYAAEKSNDNFMITIEPFDREIHRKQLLGPTIEAIEITRAVRAKTPNFGLTLDLSHMTQLGEDPIASLALAGDCLAHVHLANCVIADPEHPLCGDHHPRFGHPDGEIDVTDLTEFLRALADTPFINRGGWRGARPVVSLEVIPQPGENVWLNLAHSKRAFQLAWAMAQDAYGA